MRKIKISLLSMAVLAALGLALRSKLDPLCEDFPQYYKSGASTYSPAGEYGVDYVCFTAAGICTYYQPDPYGQPWYYAPCRLGRFQQIYYIKKKNPSGK